MAPWTPCLTFHKTAAPGPVQAAASTSNAQWMQCLHSQLGRTWITLMPRGTLNPLLFTWAPNARSAARSAASTASVGSPAGDKSFHRTISARN